MKRDPIAALETLYARLPSVDCQGCGSCCVSPTCTLVEFIYLMQFCLNTMSFEEIRRVIASSIEIHPGHDGNLRCPFIKDNRCIVHKGRTGACRLFGIPALSELQINDMVECANNIRMLSGDSDIQFIRDWLNQLVVLNKTFHAAFGQEPFFIRGFNLSSWLDLYFDDTLNFDIFGELRLLLHGAVDLSPWRADHKIKTGLKEKIEKIALFDTMLDSGERSILKKLVLSIRDDYPLTGTYFYEEAGAFLNALDAK